MDGSEAVSPPDINEDRGVDGSAVVDGESRAPWAGSDAAADAGDKDSGAAADGSAAEMDAAKGEDEGALTAEDSGMDASGLPPCDGLCAAVPPADWSGPVDLREGDFMAELVCSGGYPAELFQGHTDVVAEPLRCQCSCRTKEAFCVGAAMEVFSGSNCTGGSVASWMTLDNMERNTGCESYETRGRSVRVTPGSVTGSCWPPGGEAVNEPSVAWGKSGVACAQEDDVSNMECEEDGVCLPPVVGQLCIFKPGAADCPPGRYREHREYAQSIYDGRECGVGTCECGEVVAECDSAQLRVYDDEGCESIVGNTNFGDLAADGCFNVSGSNSAIATAQLSMTQDGFCEAKGAAAVTGWVGPEAATLTTFCCVP